MARLSRGRARRERERRPQRNGLMFWLRLIVVFLIVALLIVQVMRILEQSEWRDAELETAMFRFGQTAMLANSEWHRTGRNSPIEIRVGEGAQQRTQVLHLNSEGWPLPFAPTAASQTMNGYRCEQLWTLLTGANDLLEQNLSASWQTQNGTCIYSFNDREVFTYRLQNGHLRVLSTDVK